MFTASELEGGFLFLEMAKIRGSIFTATLWEPLVTH